jgi:hypothetical protein
VNSARYTLHYDWIVSARRLIRNVATGIMSWCLCLTYAVATLERPIDLEIKQVDGKPAACMPVNDEQAQDEIQIKMVGVARPTGPASPDITYWRFELPAAAKPVYLKRGECLLYGQSLDGAIVHTQPKALDVNRTYYISIIPGGKYGLAYSAAFCVLKQADGAIRIAVPTQVDSPCGSLGY